MQLTSDNGPPFQSHEFSRCMTALGIEHTTSTPLWPQGNAEAESFHEAPRQGNQNGTRITQTVATRISQVSVKLLSDATFHNMRTPGTVIV